MTPGRPIYLPDPLGILERASKGRIRDPFLSPRVTPAGAKPASPPESTRPPAIAPSLSGAAPAGAKPKHDPSELVMVMRRRGKSADPHWLRGQQERVKAANIEAAARTVHLRGADRVRAMNVIQRELLKKEEPKPKGA